MNKLRKIGIASDHTGVILKAKIIFFLKNYTNILDIGAYDLNPIDYPDVAENLCNLIIERKIECGILICGSGIGASIAANKINGIRAGLCHDTYSARKSVEHNHINILVLGAKVIGESIAKELVKTYLTARQSFETRHLKRIEKIKLLESKENIFN